VVRSGPANRRRLIAPALLMDTATYAVAPSLSGAACSRAPASQVTGVTSTAQVYSQDEKSLTYPTRTSGFYFHLCSGSCTAETASVSLSSRSEQRQNQNERIHTVRCRYSWVLVHRSSSCTARSGPSTRFGRSRAKRSCTRPAPGLITHVTSDRVSSKWT
jgi:hypothetical protein